MQPDKSITVEGELVRHVWTDDDWLALDGVELGELLQSRVGNVLRREFGAEYHYFGRVRITIERVLE